MGLYWEEDYGEVYNIKLALGPIEKLPKAKPNSIFYNPMEQPLLSKISIGTGAYYALSTDTYDSIASRNKIIEKQFGGLAPAMKVFASHSQHLENSWAKCGPADAPEFYAKAHQAVLYTKEGKTVDFTELNKLINEMKNSANILLQKLKSDILNECELMLKQFKRIVKCW